MNIIKVEDYAAMSLAAADIIEKIILKNPQAVLGLATGSTPIGTYEELIKRHKAGRISFKNIRTANLDEYVGLGEESEQSYITFMRKTLFSHTDIDLCNTHIPDGRAADAEAECLRYTDLLKEMPRDIQLLGLGSNGHIGFNEPHTPFGSHTHTVELAPSTVADNSRLFASIDEVPRRAITMGIADILDSKKILLLASGLNKAKAVYTMINGDIDESCPACALRLHGDVTVILDKGAASLL